MEEILNPLIGGVIIAIATSIMLLFNGKVAGISGIVKGTLAIPNKELFWRYAFVIGILIGGLAMKILAPGYFNYQFNFNIFEIFVAGLLVGVGTVIGNGCTSGHGVCGLARLSPRSLAATLTFMLVAAVTVFIKGIL
jgi:uncharacterized membrane protein YedE/YeeE